MEYGISAGTTVHATATCENTSGAWIMLGSAFSPSSSTLTLYYTPVSTAPNAVWRDGALMTNVLSKGAIGTDPTKWYWDSTNSRVYVYGSGGSPTTGGHTFEIPQRSYAIQSYDRSYVTIQNLSLAYANIYDVYLDPYSGSHTGNQHVILDTLTVQYAARHGIAVIANSNMTTVSANNTVQNCTVAYNGWTGIAFGYDVSGLTVQSNIVHDNAWDPGQTYTAGIRDVGGAPGTSVGANMLFQYNNV